MTHGVAASGVRVWVGRTADGAEERTLELSTSFPAGRLTPYRRLGTYPNGRLVVAVENEIQIWDTRSGARTSRIFTGKLDLTAKAVLSADGTRLFLQDGTISLRVWDVVAGLELLTLKLPEETRVNSTAPFRLDGERLLLPTVKGVRVYDGTPVEK